MKKQVGLLAAALFILAFSGINAVHADIIFIANKSVPVNSLEQSQIKNIFLGKLAKWPDGSSVKFVTLRGETHSKFLKRYIQRTESQYKTYWKKMLFTGKGLPPKQYETSDEVIHHIAGMEGAVGYIEKEAATDDIKILSVN